MGRPVFPPALPCRVARCGGQLLAPHLRWVTHSALGACLPACLPGRAEYYEKVTTTRKYEDRLATLEAVRQAGISVCAGGIIGLGEQELDRVGLLHQVGRRGWGVRWGLGGLGGQPSGATSRAGGGWGGAGQQGAGLGSWAWLRGPGAPGMVAGAGPRQHRAQSGVRCFRPSCRCQAAVPITRFRLPLQLATLPAHPESVPINALVAVKGTPMQNNEAPTGGCQRSGHGARQDVA